MISEPPLKDFFSDDDMPATQGARRPLSNRNLVRRVEPISGRAESEDRRNQPAGCVCHRLGDGGSLIWIKAFRCSAAHNGAMTTVVPAFPAVPPGRAVSPPVATIFLPREHGSWFLVLEPLALGLLIAPSWAGGALAAATLAGFFARRPLKPAFASAPSLRRQIARETLVMWCALAFAGMFEVVVLGG